MKPFDLLLLFHRHEWSIFQRKLFISILSRLSLEGKKNSYTFQFNAREMMEGSKMTYKELQTECVQLCNRVYQIDEPNKLLQCSLLASAAFLKGMGVIETILNPAILPYLLQLKQNYRLKVIHQVISFKSIYSVKLYLTLSKKKQNEAIKWKVDDLKEYLNNNYKDYNTFKKRVILQAQKELHLTDMAFVFQEEKVGRKVENITFKTRPIKELYFHKNEEILIKKLVKQLEISEDQARYIITKFTIQEINSIKYSILEKYRLGQIKSSLGGYSVGFFKNKI